MSTRNLGVTRRGFLGGSAAVVAGAVSSGAFGARLGAQMAKPNPTPALPLDALKATGSLDEAYWWKVRSNFNVIDGLTFMNNGTFGPVPRHVIEANNRFFREVAQDPTNNYRREDVERVRQVVAPFVGASPDEISFTRSTTEGMNLFAHGLEWQEGDEVLVNTHEHGGGLGPYRQLALRKGINIVTIDFPSPPDDTAQLVAMYEQAITPRTKVIMISHIPYVTGTVMPIKEISAMAHRNNVLVSVDGAHPLGMMDLNFHDLGCDHYAAAGQKWLLAGTGTGVNYVKLDVQPQVWPLMGSGDPRDNDQGARIYESYGQRDVPSVLGMEAAVEFHNAIGKANIEARDRALGSRLRQGLAEIPNVKLWTNDDPALACGLTLFSVGDIPMANVVEGIRAYNGVYIRTMGTGDLNAVRASTALYNFPHEVDMLLDAVKHIAANAADYRTTAA